jgi:hypothetical protein
VTKPGREIMEILEAYDLTGCAHSAAQLAGTDRKTVARYVALREAGSDPLAAQRRRPRSVGGSVEAEEQQRQSGEEDGLIQPCGLFGNLVISEKRM